MRVNRTFLYVGVFLVTLGGVLVVTDLLDLDTSLVTDALRLWPLAAIALGVGLVLRRTPAALPAGIVAAAVPGLVLGGAIASAPRFGDECVAPGQVPTIATDAGTFAGPGRVSVNTACGTFTIDTAEGNGWAFEAQGTDRPAPVVDATPGSLSIDAAQDVHWSWFGDELGRLAVSVPTSRLDDLSMEVAMGEGDVDLSGADIGHLGVLANAGQVTLDASSASVASLDGEVNLGSLSIRLPGDSDIEASLNVDAGELLVCAPQTLGLRVRHSGAAGEITADGQRIDGPSWTSANYTSAAHRADLDVDVNFGVLRINPIGGCR